ncbi:hypothetical protein ACFSBZ_06780 [Amnibacterium flavum]|uniref:hypothetical protein n=1 Tax=Amnibacterium flavum TaxID=2173173 RepID=UPI00362BD256
MVAGDDHRLANLQALCAFCHARKSSAEGHAARSARATRNRPAEEHPGAARSVFSGEYVTGKGTSVRARQPCPALGSLSPLWL